MGKNRKKGKIAKVKKDKGREGIFFEPIKFDESKVGKKFKTVFR